MTGVLGAAGTERDVAEKQKFRFIPGRGNVPIHEPKGNGSNTAAALGVAVTIALSGVTGGGLGGATSASESVSEYGSRISRNESNARANRTESDDARVSGTNDVLKITSRLRRQGYRVTVQAEPKQTNCDAHSDGDVRAFFVEHPCQSLYRQLIEIEDKKNVILLGMATIQMPDFHTAIGLKILLDQADRGSIIQLSRDSGKFRYFSFTNSIAHTTLYDTTVTAYDAQVVSGAVPDAILITFLKNALFGIGG